MSLFCGQLHAAASVKAAAVAELERRWRAPSALSRWRGCSRQQGRDSSRPPGQDMLKRLCLLLRGRELFEQIDTLLGLFFNTDRVRKIKTML